MNLKRSLSYLDQGIASLVFFSLNVLPPLCMDSASAASVLYSASWAVLGVAFAQSLFGVPLLSTYRAGMEWIISEIAYFYIATVLAIGFCIILLDLYFCLFQRVSLGFFFFIFVSGGAEIARRGLLVQGKTSRSCCISVVYFSSIIVGVLAGSASNDAQWIWAIASALTGSYVFFIFTNDLLVFSRAQRTLADVAFHLKSVLVQGSYSLLSFGIFWAGTQGLFIFFYDVTDANVFVQQKILFSIMGLSTVLMVVQENRFQPLYVLLVNKQDRTRLLAAAKEISKQNWLFIFATVTVSTTYSLIEDYPLTVLALMILHRQVFGLAKEFVYFLRATLNHRAISISSSIACIACFFTAFTVNAYVPYAISYGLAAYGVAFYISCYIFKKTLEAKIVCYWNN